MAADPGRERRPRRPSACRPARDERGSAVAEYVLVSGLLSLLFFGVLQVGVVLHVRNVLVASAAEGARQAAAAGADPDRAAATTSALVRRALSAGTAAAFPPVVTQTTVAGLPAVQVELHGSLPLFLLPLGRVLPITVRAHALDEQP
ncbi:MAG: hypothetical protein JWM67_2847 [Mycobacterium sp.]|nr:hypothetical protein [Mycobacterium sp.]